MTTVRSKAARCPEQRTVPTDHLCSSRAERKSSSTEYTEQLFPIMHWGPKRDYSPTHPQQQLMEESKTRMSYGTAGRTSASFNLPAGRAGMPVLICTFYDLRIATVWVRPQPPPDPGTYSDFSDHAVDEPPKELAGCIEAPFRGVWPTHETPIYCHARSPSL